ncbi:MAG: hypothetical protein ABSF26_00535 [Thermoguttaceae bacterium]|jgi:hypothetical protein
MAAATAARAEYKETAHRQPAPGETAVSGPGAYDQPGRTYVLTADISGPMTPIFLGKDVTLDLNGYTLTFAAGNYEHIPNYGFEEGLKDWDVSRAPGAQVVSSAVRPMVGQKILQLKAGDEIVSQYIRLPVADRSYYAMCAVATKDMRVTINVDDQQGAPVACEFRGGKEPRVSLPETALRPQLGGGVTFAHLHHRPAGRYRLRIKAETDCLIDECDLRPALDAGIAVVGGICPWASYYSMLRWSPCAFFDYNKKDTPGVAVTGIPVVKGAGTVTIRNGVIRNATPGIRTWGVLSNAGEVSVVLENLRIVNSDINSNAARLSRGTLRDCRFEVDTPFIINRHDTSEASVNVAAATEVVHCEFLGGQGNFSGACPQIHDNLFVNAETVVNHYSIAPGSGTKVYRNRFEPKAGSGIYIGGGSDVEVYDNVFHIESSPPNCEYRYTTYSTSAVRLSDYDAKPTDPPNKRCAGNRVYRNRIFITGKSYPQYERYLPRTYAFFISVGGGTNLVYDNEIVLEKKDAGNCGIYAFFVGGSSNGGQIFNNRVVSNCPVAWLGTDYGNAANMVFYGNTFVRAADTPAKTRPIVLGAGGNAVLDAGFLSNTFQGWNELFETHSNSVTYTMGWTLKIRAPAGEEIVILDKEGKEVQRAKASPQGSVMFRLAQYRINAGTKTDCSTYTVQIGNERRTIQMNEDREIRFK